MAPTPRPSSPLDAYEPHGLRFTTEYFKRLIIERHGIRAALENPGGSVILTGVAATTETPGRYSSVVGNDYHLDLLDAELIVNRLTPRQRRILIEWLDGLPATEMAHYYGIKPGSLRMSRTRVDRAVRDLIEPPTDGV